MLAKTAVTNSKNWVKNYPLCVLLIILVQLIITTINNQTQCYLATAEVFVIQQLNSVLTKNCLFTLSHVHQQISKMC